VHEQHRPARAAGVDVAGRAGPGADLAASGVSRGSLYHHFAGKDADARPSRKSDEHEHPDGQTAVAQAHIVRIDQDVTERNLRFNRAEMAEGG
jgi:AcrR family transcriptional regulator